MKQAEKANQRLRRLYELVGDGLPRWTTRLVNVSAICKRNWLWRKVPWTGPKDLVGIRSTDDKIAAFATLMRENVP